MQPDAPIISLDDLIARPGTNSSALVRPLLFDRCRATTAEIEMVEQHVRRSLLCPLLVSNAQLPPHEAREELLRAVLDELHNHADTGAAAAERNDSSGEGTMPSASRPPLGEALRPTLALRMALSDVEASAAACARAAEGRPFAVISDAEPSSSSDAAAAPAACSRLRQVLAERARWLRKAEALQQLARPLRQMLGISDPMSSQHQPQLVQHERAQQHGGGIGVDNGGTNGVGGAEQSGGSSSTRVRRALSFEKGAKVASGVRRALSFDRSKHRGVGADGSQTTRSRVDAYDAYDATPLDSSSTSTDAVAGIGTPASESMIGDATRTDTPGGSSGRVGRSLSFDRLRKRLGGGSGHAAVRSSPASSKQQQQQQGPRQQKQSAASNSSKQRNKEAMRRVANASAAPSASAAPRSSSVVRTPQFDVSTLAAEAFPRHPPTPPFECAMPRACRIYEVLLFALVAAWQRRAIAALCAQRQQHGYHHGGYVGADGGGTGCGEPYGLPEHMATPFPVEEDGSLLLLRGLSGWLLDEVAARCGCSPLMRALGALSAAMEGAIQADADGKGSGASPDILRLACDALAQSLIAMQAEEVEATSSGLKVAHQAVGELRQRSREDIQRQEEFEAERSQQRYERSIKSRAGGVGMLERQPTIGRRWRRSGIALAYAITSVGGRGAAGGAGDGAASRRTQSVIDKMRSSILASPTFRESMGHGDGDGREQDDDHVEEEEDGAVSIGQSELDTYVRCMTCVWTYVGRRLPGLISDRDEAGDGDTGGNGESGSGDGGEEGACAELLVHLLSLSHRLCSEKGGNGVSGGGAARAEGAGSSAGDTAGSGAELHRFVWQTELCPPALASTARAALRSAVTLVCDQEMRAAMQTGGSAAAARRQRPHLTRRGGTKAWLWEALPPKVSAAAADANAGADAWVQMVRLRRLRERLQRVLEGHIALLSSVAGGGPAVLRVWAEALWVAVIEPLHSLCAAMRVGPATAEVLCLCLEHRRVSLVLHTTLRSLERRSMLGDSSSSSHGGDDAAAAASFPHHGPNGLVAGEAMARGGHDGTDADADAALARMQKLAAENAFHADSDDVARLLSPEGDCNLGSEELAAISDRTFYSPYVFDWLQRASGAIAAWLRDALAGEHDRGWAPVGAPLGAGRHSRTLTMLFAACFTLVRSLRRLGILGSGEAVSAAHVIADHFNAFVAAIEVSALAADAEEAGGIGFGTVGGEASGQGRREGGGCGEERPDLEVKRQLDAARELLFLLRIEPSTPADDPLFAATADDGTAAGRTEAIVGGGGASSNGTRLGEGAVDINETLDAPLLEDRTLRVALGYPEEADEASGGAGWAVPHRSPDATAASEVGDYLCAVLLDDPPSVPSAAVTAAGTAAGMPTLPVAPALARTAEEAEARPRTTTQGLRLRCLLASNAAAARRHLEELACILEDGVAASAEQRQIISDGFVEAFGRLRRAVDTQMAHLLARLLAPLASYMCELSPHQMGAQPRARVSAEEGDEDEDEDDGAEEESRAERGWASTAASRSRSRGDESSRALGRLMRSYQGGIRWLRAYLGADALKTLLQRMWVEGLLLLSHALSQHMFVPKEIGDAFTRGALALLDSLAVVLDAAGEGPTPEWLRRRAAPLRSTLELCRLSTLALLQQYRIQPAGPRRTAPLVALALRLDDREAAEHVCTREPSELSMGDDGGDNGGDNQGGEGARAKALAVDGVAALEAVRKGESRLHPVTSPSVSPRGPT